ncbi:MAG: type II toxin-antitoxin system PrlF family antitoxin [Gracilimonas sp.]|uniref:AbrB/MazE/SpoVT family DNA-binding domain-containing protein n=1 Tax=Gracilimonas TaxID=649462 RepID=UPI001B1D2B80|nr:AbrB/MazE/SpoVT family DNA-binding domain-containing protein [Gracilimonas sp.]MBO6584616.1 type II toxin-antitoxin system PrlF family antitoxin [Gracilimonas sp.]MBO6616113.1 type II toxin-antitoxin system PrlF family antitoxin [Gracilimonas sp.]
MPTATITSKGQVTIPKKIRDELGLKPGDKLDFEIDEQGKIGVSKKKFSIMDMAGILHRPGQKAKTIEEMNKGVAEYFRKKYKK